MTTQLKFANLDEARTAAIELSMKTDYAAIILSEDQNGVRFFYVEDGSPFIRNFEKLVAEYKNGKLAK